jgi:hypothetical protein
MEGDMRKFMLITAMVLASATAQAGDPRGLTIGSDSTPVKSAEAKTADAKTADGTAEAPKYVERPSAVESNTSQPTAQPAAQCQPAPTTTRTTPKYFAGADRPKRRHQSTEARIVSELHRHGIYW